MCVCARARVRVRCGITPHVRAGATPLKEDILAHLTSHVAKWWLPDDVVFTDDMPHTATGKILKTELRTRYKDFKWHAHHHAAK